MALTGRATSHSGISVEVASQLILTSSIGMPPGLSQAHVNGVLNGVLFDPSAGVIGAVGGTGAG